MKSHEDVDLQDVIDEKHKQLFKKVWGAVTKYLRTVCVEKKKPCELWNLGIFVPNSYFQKE